MLNNKYLIGLHQLCIISTLSYVYYLDLKSIATRPSPHNRLKTHEKFTPFLVITHSQGIYKTMDLTLPLI